MWQVSKWKDVHHHSSLGNYKLKPHHTVERLKFFQCIDNTKRLGDAKQLELSCVAGGSATWYGHLENSLKIPFDLLLYSWVFTLEKWNTLLGKPFCKCCCTVTLFVIAQKTETTQMDPAGGERINKAWRIMWFLGSKKERSSDPHNTMDKSPMRYVFWKKSDSRYYMLCDSLSRISSRERK